MRACQRLDGLVVAPHTTLAENQTVAEKVLRRVSRKSPDWCFSQKDFMDVSGRNALDKAFSRLLAEGKIRRVGRGLYDVPRDSELLKTTLSPSSDQVAQAIARKHGWNILPTGAHAANMLNLSTQVPMKIAYQSDGSSKNMEFGNHTIYFKHTAPRNMAPNELSGLVVNALNYLGKEHVTPEVVARPRRRFDAKQKKQLLKGARFSTDWIFETIQTICAEEGSNG